MLNNVSKLLTNNILQVNTIRNFKFNILSKIFFNSHNSVEEPKMVFVVRTDLNMTVGKIATQCAHAALECYKIGLRKHPQMLQTWENFGKTKVVLKATGEEALFNLQARANSLGLINVIIRDAGRTQVAVGSVTVLGIGPGPILLVNEVTGHLKLF